MTPETTMPNGRHAREDDDQPPRGDGEERWGPFKLSTWTKILDRIGTVAILLAITFWLGYRVEAFLMRVDTAIVEIGKRHHEDATSVAASINRLAESQVELRIALSRIAGSAGPKPNPNN